MTLDKYLMPSHMRLMNTVDHILSLLSWLLIGTQLLSIHWMASGRLLGWILGATSQVGWLWYGVVTGQYAFVLGCVVSIIVHVRGCWRVQAGVASNPAINSDK